MSKTLVSMILAPGALAWPAFAGETTVTLTARNWYCAACPHVIKQSLAAVPGIINVTVSDKTKTGAVTVDDTKTGVKSLTEATAGAGYHSLTFIRKGCCGREGSRFHDLRPSSSVPVDQGGQGTGPPAAIT